MKKLIDIKSLILGGLLGGAIIMTVGAAFPEPAMEYKHLSGVSEGAINQMADEGWTVVGFSEYLVNHDTRTSYLLKRAKRAKR